MKATATVGEYALKDSARVLLGTPPRLQLVADKQAITAGETVTFTTSAGGEPYTISSWVYRVDSTSQTVACGTALQCVTPLTTTGTMWVFGAVLDRPDSASTPIQVAPLHVRIQPVSGDWNVGPAGTGGTSTLDLEVGVFDANGQARPNRTVSLFLASMEGTAGHVHVGGKPTGAVSINPVNTGASGVRIVQYFAPAAAGPVGITGTSADAQAANGTISVLVGGLQALGASSYYTLIGDVPDTHTVNHYGFPAFNTALEELAERFFQQFGSGLEYNDMSLVLGGVFDLRGDWQSPHGEHKIGLNLDLRTFTLAEAQLDFVELVWFELSSVPDADAIHKETTPPHWHLRY